MLPPFTAVGADADRVYCSYYIRCIYIASWVGAAPFDAVSADAAPFFGCCRHACCHQCRCSKGTRPFILLFGGAQMLLLLTLGVSQQYLRLHPSLTRRTPSRPPPAALSQVVSSGDETGCSRRFRSSTRPGQGDHDRDNQRAHSRSSASGRGDLPEEERSGGGYPEGSTHHSPDPRTSWEEGT